MCKLGYLIVFQLGIVLGSVNAFRRHYHTQLKDTTPEVIPYHAFVDSTYLACNGILISEDFVLTIAECLHGLKTVKVFLGFNEYPYFRKTHKEPYAQIRQSSKIIIHEDFVRIADDDVLNNIALIQLSKPVIFNSVIRPAKFFSENNIHSIYGKSVNISGWTHMSGMNLKYATVKLRNEDTCKFLFGLKYLTNQQLCVRWDTGEQMSLNGNPVSLEDRVLGMQTRSPLCLLQLANCSEHDVILKLTAFLGWISEITGLSQTELTGETEEEQDWNEVNPRADTEEYEKKQDIDIKNLQRSMTAVENKLKFLTNEEKKNELNDKIKSLEQDIEELRNIIQTDGAKNIELHFLHTKELKKLLLKISNVQDNLNEKENIFFEHLIRINGTLGSQLKSQYDLNNKTGHIQHELEELKEQLQTERSQGFKLIYNFEQVKKNLKSTKTSIEDIENEIDPLRKVVKKVRLNYT